MIAVEVDGPRKSYGAVAVVDDLSFTIEQGEIFALLGPNGAGKTTPRWRSSRGIAARMRAR
ncbi:ATP-binding cassette domain-containing protein [Marisediminicola antarctica]|uniref:ABC transporter domain-containing protein n=1 Tax=Marisediminicola antarctica TaxID=674079 RepID=A0A7L5AI57_9MICO|nr:hypothetical protein BHD05_11930 [Marisediminicola antarctica]